MTDERAKKAAEVICAVFPDVNCDLGDDIAAVISTQYKSLYEERNALSSDLSKTMKELDTEFAENERLNMLNTKLHRRGAGGVR